jgi:hypothetical protein
MMVYDREGTVIALARGRKAGNLIVGCYLRVLRRDQGRTRESAASAVKIQASRLRDIEDGVVAASAQDAVRLLSLYCVRDPDRVDAVSALLSQADRPGNLSTGAVDSMPGWVERLAAVELQAVGLYSCCHLRIPSHLQIPAYAEGRLAGFQGKLTTSCDRVALLARLSQVGGQRVVKTLLDEPLVRRPLAEPAVAVDQFTHLMNESARGRADIRVVTLDSGQLMPGHQLTEMTLDGVRGPRTVLVEESINGASYSTAPDELEHFSTRFGAAFTAAETQEDSVNLLRQARSAAELELAAQEMRHAGPLPLPA